jgi:hypothetical protein
MNQILKINLRQTSKQVDEKRDCHQDKEAAKESVVFGLYRKTGEIE